MHINIFVVITLIMVGTVVYASVKAQLIVKQLMLKIDIPRHWSGRISEKELSQLQSVTDDKIILKEVARAIFFLKLTKYVAWGGFILFVILMFAL